MACDRTKVITFLESAHNTSYKSSFKIKTAKPMYTSVISFFKFMGLGLLITILVSSEKELV
jgi:hypothetical protein